MYQENFDESLTDDLEHESVERSGYCTLVKRAGKLLEQNCDYLKKFVYGEVKCVKNENVSYLLHLTYCTH